MVLDGEIILTKAVGMRDVYIVLTHIPVMLCTTMGLVQCL